MRRRFEMKCDEVDKLISDYSVGNLSAKKMEQMQEHLEACETCSCQLDYLHQILSHVEDIEPVHPPVGLWNGVYNRIAEPSPARGFNRFRGVLRKAVAVGVATVVLSAAVFVGLTNRHAQTIAKSPDPGTMEYVNGHLYSASNDPFADRVSLNVVSAMDSQKGQNGL
jgi:hypothetical protein